MSRLYRGNNKSTAQRRSFHWIRHAAFVWLETNNKRLLADFCCFRFLLFWFRFWFPSLMDVESWATIPISRARAWRCTRRVFLFILFDFLFCILYSDETLSQQGISEPRTYSHSTAIVNKNKAAPVNCLAFFLLLRGFSSRSKKRLETRSDSDATLINNLGDLCTRRAQLALTHRRAVSQLWRQDATGTNENWKL